MTDDIICFSHLRWDFVYQRPNHLMTRAASARRVFYVEEPMFEDSSTAAAGALPRVVERMVGGVHIMTPVLPEGLDETELAAVLADLMRALVADARIERPVLWYYTPMALAWTRHLPASARVYDCMDHLAGFRGAPPRLLALEEELVHQADVVFTGGARLHGRMAGRHAHAHCFPSSVDARHFRAGRAEAPEPATMAGLRRPRIGYAGVIDERLDLDLIAGVAAARPAWEFVLVGPIAKISAASVPAGPNIHLLGKIDYADLPAHLGSWDIGWMPFAHNEATRYISPTKTPEYLAAGLHVVSTSIHDVIEPYGRLELAAIADDVDGTIAAMERLLDADRSAHLGRADAFLATNSWDRTWSAMQAVVDDIVTPRHGDPAVAERRERRPARRLLVRRTGHVAPRIAGEKA